MGLFGKTKDPMASREEALEREIAQLQRRIADLAARPLPPVKPAASRPPSSPSSSSPSQVPTGVAAPAPSSLLARFPNLPAPAPKPAALPNSAPEPGVSPQRYNLAEAWDRMKARLAGRPRPPSGLVNLMAAGSVHGLRPLRYERKIARRRFLFSLTFLLLVLYGIARVVFRDGL